MKTIGGDFPLDPSTLSGAAGPVQEEPILYESGRSALLSLLLGIRSKKACSRLALPGYICQSVISASKAAGLEIGFYRVGEDLLPDEGSLRRILSIDGIAVVLVNYFGLLEMEPTIRLVRAINESAFIILDKVQAPFTMHLDEGADACFTSFRKAWPAPHGAVLWTRSPMSLVAEECDDQAAAHRLLGMIRKHMFLSRGVGKEEDFLRPIAEGEKSLDAAMKPRFAGPEASVALRAIDRDGAGGRRRTNYLYLHTELQARGLPLGPELRPRAVPLFMPVMMEGRDAIRRELARRRLFFPSHWPVPAELRGREVELAGSLYAKELSFVIDQRYKQDDMDCIVDAMSELAAGRGS